MENRNVIRFAFTVGGFTMLSRVLGMVRDVLTRLRERGLVRKNQSSHWIAGPLTAQTTTTSTQTAKVSGSCA